MTEKSTCPAPARSLSAQAFDFCFFVNETDDIAHPKVQTCYSRWMSFPDSCEIRTMLKTERCRALLAHDLLVKIDSFSACVRSKQTEGYLVNGCDYPFAEECIDRVNRSQ